MHAENAFSAAHSQQLLFPTDAWRDALARLDAGLGTREPFLIVTGEAGTGKTALVLEAAAAWGARAAVAFVTNPALTRAEFVEEVARRFGAEPPANASKPQLLACLEQTLAQVVGSDQVAVLVVEEAHQLDPDLIDELRLLVNSAAQAQRPFEAILVGLPALDGRLAEPALASLRQRVAVHCRLLPLSRKETRRYLHHRVTAAGGDGPGLFPRQTCNEIYDRTRGIPRAINTLAAEAMRVAGAAGQNSVSAEHVQTAASRICVDAVAGGRTGNALAAEVALRAAPPTESEPEQTRSAPERVAESIPEIVATRATRAAAATRAVSVNPTTAEASATAGAAATAEAPGTPGAAATAVAPGTPGAAATAVAPGTPGAAATAVAPGTPGAAASSEAALAVTDLPSIEMDPKDPRAQDWISRFVDSSGPPRFGVALMEPLDPSELESLDAAEPGASSAQPAPESAALVPASDEITESATPRSHTSPRPRKLIRLEDSESVATATLEAPVRGEASASATLSRGRRGESRTGPAFAVGVLFVAAVGAIVLLAREPELDAQRGNPAVPAPLGTADSAATTSPSADAPVSKRQPGSAAVPAPANSSSATRTTVSSDARVQPVDPKPANAAKTTAETEPEKRLALEVGTYIDAERARLERDNLAAETGLRVWVTRVSEYGGESYRVVLGPFTSEERAEASASYLLERGLVSEARVVELPPQKPRR